MDAGILVSAHASSLCPIQPTAIPVHTARNDAPIPSHSSDPDQFLEHATYSSVFNSPATGTILLRVLHGGLILELLSLSTNVPPLRFVFPALILNAPAIFAWDPTELHVLAATSTASLYRLVIPIGAARRLWGEDTGNVWIREHLIKAAPADLLGPAHMQGVHCVAIGLTHGGLLRIESESLGSGDQQDEWLETIFHHSSFLSSLTSFLQTGSDHNASEIVSMATVPWPTDIGHIWSLSRDRTLRLWKAKAGCVSSKALSITGPGRESTPKHQLLDGTPQTLLRAFGASSSDDQIYILAFIPTISSSTSGGVFRLITTIADHLHDLGGIECSPNTAHCRLQDFMVIDNLLYTLWDHQGQSLVERTVINVEPLSDQDQQSWHAVYAYPEPEHTPGYLEKLLLSPGSIVEKGLEVVLRPGAFSIHTLRRATDDYIEACLALPGGVPPQLTISYTSVAENIASVVGCTVKLVHDAQTGAPQYASYWNSMKRDWEGFISRCSRLERLGCRPLALGVEDRGNVVVVERERIRALVREDLALYLRRLLSLENPSIDAQYDILTSSWMLSSTLNPQVVANLENRLNDLFQQGITFSLSDIIQDQANRSKLIEYVDDGTSSWVIGRLQNLDDLDAAIKAALDVIGGLDMEVKREEDEVELLLPPANSHWLRATTSSYTAATVNARYDLCLSLVILLFFLASDLAEWGPSLLAEVLAVFRGVAMIRLTSKQTGNDSSKAKNLSPDDVVTRMRNMHVSRHKAQTTPQHSLIQRFLAETDAALSISGTAHQFLDSSGLLQSVSPAHATKYEIFFCERLRQLGCYDLAQELLSWLPKTPGVNYVQSCLWIDVGRADDAAERLQRLAGSFGIETSLSTEDQESLAIVLPANERFDSDFKFYVHVAGIFKRRSLVCYEVLFARLAISVAPGHTDTSALWLSVIDGYIELGRYESAYSSLMCLPYEKQKRECISRLTYNMCEDGVVNELLAFNFAGISDEVEDALSFKARNVDPRAHPCYAKILYAWYTSRGDHRKAALAMYDRAHKIHDLIADTQSFLALAEEQLLAYTVAINSLSLVDPGNAWFVLSSTTESNPEARKTRRITKHIPGSGKYEAEVIQLSDIQHDYAALSAHIDLVRSDPSLLSAEDFFLPTSLIILKLAQANHLTQAITYARSLKIDMTDLFTHLTRQCLRLSRNPDATIQEDTLDWLFSGTPSSWSGSVADRAWKYLRQALDLHDSAEMDYKYTKAALQTIAAHDRKHPPPPWITNILEEFDPEFLIRVSLSCEKYADAIEHSLSLIRKCNDKVIRDPPQNASTTWLPYTLLDQVLMTSKSLEKSPAHLSNLEKELSDYIRRIQKLSDSHPVRL
ncbi:hypothetical protein AX15_002475 [Amanita polypyramis BW_CC]|nr:hypothetical protein AX15_002475 [Amanita polypyramis BW_CC]